MFWRAANSISNSLFGNLWDSIVNKTNRGNPFIALTISFPHLWCPVQALLLCYKVIQYKFFSHMYVCILRKFLSSRSPYDIFKRSLVILTVFYVFLPLVFLPPPPFKQSCSTIPSSTFSLLKAPIPPTQTLYQFPEFLIAQTSCFSRALEILMKINHPINRCTKKDENMDEGETTAG